MGLFAADGVQWTPTSRGLRLTSVHLGSLTLSCPVRQHSSPFLPCQSFGTRSWLVGLYSRLLCARVAVVSFRIAFWRRCIKWKDPSSPLKEATVLAPPSLSNRSTMYWEPVQSFHIFQRLPEDFFAPSEDFGSFFE